MTLLPDLVGTTDEARTTTTGAGTEPTTCHEQVRHILKATAPGGSVAIVAPTGTGKTTAMYREVCAKRSEKTVFMLHTRLSLRALEAREGRPPAHVRLYTPRGMIGVIQAILRGTRRVDNVIIDEAHVMSPEYEALFGLLARLRLATSTNDREKRTTRVFLMSATLDEARVSREMPGTRLVRIPVLSKYPGRFMWSPFPDEDFYVERNYAPPVSNLVEKIVELLFRALAMSMTHTLVPRKNRVLVFLPSHDLCERVKREFGAKTSEFAVTAISIHGGLSDEDLDKNRKMMMNPRMEGVVCCTTNMSETAVTFPGITDVIDSGLRCVVRDGRIVTEWCDRASMIQRAGRTNRTCAGTVYRCLSEQGFERIPMHRPPDHDYDGVVLDLLQMRIDPSDALGDKAETSLAKVRDHGVKPEMYTFLSRSRLLIEHGMVLYQLTRRAVKFSYPEEFRALVVLCVTIISLCKTQPIGWVYTDRGMTRTARAREIARVRRWASVEDDPLATLVTVFCRVFTSEDPKKMAADFSLNFRVLRDHRARFRALMRLCFPRDSRASVEGEEDTGDTEGPRHRPEEALRGVYWDAWGDRVRAFLSDTLLAARHPLPVDRYFQDPEDQRYFGEDNTSTLWTLGTRTDKLFRAPRFALPLVASSSGNLWMDVVLWTWVGVDFREYPYMLDSHVEDAEREREAKRGWRCVFTEDVVREIREEVAFRPGMHGMMMALEDFHTNAVSQN